MADLDKMVETLDALSITECADLVKMLEDKWNVKANPYEGMEMPTMPDETPAAAAKTEFDVELTSFEPTKKIKVIQAVRPILGLPLRDTKELVEKAPVMLKEGIGESDAEELKRIVEEVGGVVTIK